MTIATRIDIITISVGIPALSTCVRIAAWIGHAAYCSAKWYVMTSLHWFADCCSITNCIATEATMRVETIAHLIKPCDNNCFL